MLIEDRRIVPLTLLAQAGVTVGLALLLGMWASDVVALSALLGGSIAVIPNGFLAARVLAPRGTDAKALLRAAWFGEIGKLGLTALFFGAAFALIEPLSAPAVFGGFIAAQLAMFAAAALGGLAVKHGS